MHIEFLKMLGQYLKVLLRIMAQVFLCTLDLNIPYVLTLFRIQCPSTLRFEKLPST